MTRYTQKQLREMVKDGIAVDITYSDNAMHDTIEKEEGYYNQIGYSVGIYGWNGMLLKGHKTGKLYAITSRTTAIFIY